jgi:hypothetical protein
MKQGIFMVGMFFFIGTQYGIMSSLSNPSPNWVPVILFFLSVLCIILFWHRRANIWYSMSAWISLVWIIQLYLIKLAGDNPWLMNLHKWGTILLLLNLPVIGIIHYKMHPGRSQNQVGKGSRRMAQWIRQMFGRSTKSDSALSLFFTLGEKVNRE